MIDIKEDEKDVDIPDFVETKDEKDPDLSVFKFDEDDKDEVDDEEEYEDEEEERHHLKLSAKGYFYIACAVCALLLIATIAGWVFGISKSNSLSKTKTELDAKTVEVEKLQDELDNAQKQIGELEEKTKGSTQGKYAGPGTYEIMEPTGVNLRVAAGTDEEVVKLLEQGTQLEVTETMEIADEEGGFTVWGHCSEGWFAITMSENFSVLAEKLQ